MSQAAREESRGPEGLERLEAATAAAADVEPTSKASAAVLLRRWATVDHVCFTLAALAILGAIFYRFGTLPLGLFQDETSQGYAARCLDRTLADSTGKTLPVFFLSLGDWLDGVPIYAMAVTEAVFGATPFGVRLPSALFMIGMAVGLYFILRALTGRPPLARWLALLSLFIPSVFLYARFGFGATCVPCLLVIALAAIYRFERSPSWQRAAVAGVAIGLWTYTYPTGRMLAPFLTAVAAVSFWFHAPTRKHVWALVVAAGLCGLPMGVYLLKYPGRLTTRLAGNSAWRDHPGNWEVAKRIAHTYYQHLLQIDFLFRTGQHVVWHNAGEGLLPVWMAGAVLLGLGSLWLRRHLPFARTLMAMMVLSPLPVSLTLQQDFPHTSRTLQLIPLAVIAAGLAIHDFLLSQKLPRWLPALAIAGALFEGGQDLWIYFTDYAVAQVRSEDWDRGPALQILFAHRQGEEPVYMPEDFFWFEGVHLKFFGDLDPVRLRQVGLAGMGFHRDKENPPPGSLLIMGGDRKAPEGATLLGQTPLDTNGPPAWAVYRLAGP